MSEEPESSSVARSMRSSAGAKLPVRMASSRSALAVAQYQPISSWWTAWTRKSSARILLFESDGSHSRMKLRRHFRRPPDVALIKRQGNPRLPLGILDGRTRIAQDRLHSCKITHFQIELGGDRIGPLRARVHGLGSLHQPDRVGEVAVPHVFGVGQVAQGRWEIRFDRQRFVQQSLHLRDIAAGREDQLRLAPAQ